MADSHADADSKPAHILFLCHPLTGHLTPALRVASELRRRGWPVTFLGPTTHGARISAAGVQFLPLRDDADIDDLAYYSADSPRPPVPGYHALPWQDRALVDLEKHFVDPIPAQWRCVQDALVRLHDDDPHRPVVVITEAFCAGSLPLPLGAPLPAGAAARPRATLCLSVTPPALRSADLPPFGFPLPFAPDHPHYHTLRTRGSPARARNARAWAEWAVQTAPLRDRFRARLAEAGVPADRLPEGPLLDGVHYTSHDAVLQIGVPGFEYPRADWPPRFQFVGFLPPAPAPAGGWPDLPPWWDEVVAAATATDGKKQIVVVAQGTVETNPHDLIIPTLEAMRGRGDDVLVVAILGRRGARLPEDFAIPDNARVTDYLHYDAVLPHARAWVHNGGYGAITHGVAHGVPMVVAGEGQDKPENIKRVRYSGIGVGLGTGRPTVGDLQLSLEDVLAKDKYRTRVAALRKQTMDLDCFGRIEKAVLKALE